MKVLITGVNGFVGKHLLSYFEEKSILVIGFGSEKDVTKPDCFNEYFDIGITHVIHLASKNFVPGSWTNPSEYMYTNVVGTTNVLEFCSNQNAQLIFFSSYMYGVPINFPINEMHPISCNNPYALSKKFCEELCEFYIKNKGLSIAVLRIFNIYGPNQSMQFLIPHILKQASEGNVVKVRDITPKRDYLFISDFVNLIGLIINKNINSGFYNVGYGASISVEDIIINTGIILKKSIEIISENLERQNEIPNVIADITKVKDEFNWTPIVTINDGLSKCLASFK
jgi:nucleoside-diphosphate-sugar epimerase